MGHAVTLRTALPQASRVVMPTAASRRISVGRVFDVDEVELDVLARGDVAGCRREYSSASSARTSSCAGREPPKGILMRCMPGASHSVSGPLVSVARRVGERPRAAAVVPLAVVVALPVGAPPQPGLDEEAGIDAAAPHQFELGLVLVDLAFEHRVGLARERLLPGGGHRLQLPGRPGAGPRLMISQFVD